MAQQNSTPDSSASPAEREQAQSITTTGETPHALNSEMSKAFQELLQGEKTATALEAKLDGIESRIDQLLAAMEANVQGGQGSDTSNSR